MMVEDKYIVHNQSVLEFVNGDVNTSQAQHMHRRNYESFKKLQDLVRKELSDIQKPFPSDPKKVNAAQMKKLIDHLVSFYKIHRKTFKGEIVEARIVLLRKKKIGEYII